MEHPLLHNDQIRLRAIEEEIDLPLLYQWENDSLSWDDSTSSIHPIPSQFIRDFIAHSGVSLLETGQLFLIIEDCTTKQAVGYLQLLEFSLIHQRTEVAVYIAPEFRGEGRAYNALGLLLRYAEQKLRCSHFFVRVLESNLPSQRLFEKLGFKHTATLPNWHWSEGNYQALYYYQLWSQ